MQPGMAQAIYLPYHRVATGCAPDPEILEKRLSIHGRLCY
jgi:hypothetical protein